MNDHLVCSSGDANSTDQHAAKVVASTGCDSIAALFRRAVEQYAQREALGVIENDRLRWLTWQQLSDGVEWRANKLREAGIQPGDRIVQCLPNSRQWIENDLALATIGAVHVPLHASNTDALNQRLISHADVAATIDGEASLVIDRRTAAREPTPPGVATIVYTSGTAGSPRGVMLTTDNLLANVADVVEAAGSDRSETRLSVLPFSHAYARTCDLYTWIMRGSRLVLSRGRSYVSSDLQIATPTVLLGVPYLFEKLSASASAAELRQRLGGNMRRCYSGGAPLASRTVSRFREAGVPLYDGYGLTEAAPVVAMVRGDATQNANEPCFELGTVGRPLSSVKVRLTAAGELRVSGSNIMAGYWRDPAATERAFDDGWLCTGDLAQWTRDGNLRILGRRRDRITLSTGHKVVPAAVEACLTSSPLIEQAIVIGEGRPCIVALLVPNPDLLRREIRQRRLWVWSKRRAVSHPVVQRLFHDAIAEATADLPAYERPHAFTVLTRGFSAERGEITPKLSLKRDRIAEHFASTLEKLYRQIATRPPSTP